MGTSAFTLGAQNEFQQRKSAAVKHALLPRGPSAVRLASTAAMSKVVGKIGTHDPLRCFSLCLWRPEEDAETSKNILSCGAAGLGLQTIDLELPDGGNGRSVREWCDAIMGAAKEHGGGKVEDEDRSQRPLVRTNSGRERWETLEQSRGEVSPAPSHPPALVGEANARDACEETSTPSPARRHVEGARAELNVERSDAGLGRGSGDSGISNTSPVIKRLSGTMASVLDKGEMKLSDVLGNGAGTSPSLAD